MMRRRSLACSFCRRREGEVGKLVAGPRLLLLGPRVHICDRCVGVAHRIMEQTRGDEPPPIRGTGGLRRVLERFGAR